MGMGGIETMLLNIANEQVKTNRVGIIVINNIAEPSLIEKFNKKVDLYFLKREVGSFNPFFILKLNHLLYKIKPDIIHLHYNSIFRFLFLPNLKKKCCVTLHDVCSPVNAKYLHKFDRIYSISNVVKENVRRVKHLDSEVVLNGIKPDLIIKKESLTPAAGVFKIVQLGRLMHEKKGQHILIDAVRLLEEKGIHTIQLFFIGEGESEEYLKNRVDRYNMNNNVFFLGIQTQDFVFQHLHEYDLLVQPSIYEGFGLTVAEGMAAGIPVLVSKQQGPLEIIDQGECGYYFESEDPQSCAAMILKIMNDPDKPTIVEKAYRRVYELYNVANTAANYLKKYEEILNGKE
jgi:glycosyltransferase involved in cell wall biosynthesis